MSTIHHRLLLAAVGFLVASPATARDSVPRFEKAACPQPVAPGERIDCGTLVVPEHRGKAGTRSIRLPVVILRSASATPAPDPVVYLPGGPGLSSIDGHVSTKGNPFLAERDQILLEGRGNKFAQPSLDCPELNVLRAGKAAEAAQVEAVLRCRAVLTASGTDLDGYTSAEAADDLDDLRRLLGIRQWNLIGLSYGTRLAQTVLARHPDGVRSVILDSVLPADVNYDETASSALRRALDQLFDGCAADPSCVARHGDLRERFAALIARAERGIATPSGRPVSARDIVEAIGDAIQTPSMIPQLPEIIADAADGRIASLLPLLEPTPSSFNWGLRLSIWCAEEMPFENQDRMAGQISSSMGLGGADLRTATPAMCAAWNVATADRSANEAVATTVPVLILAGEFDPVTPPAWGRRLLTAMPNARFVQIPGQSHGAMFNRCGGRLALAFLHDPTAPLDLDCVAKMPGPAFSGK